jgi:hypothetical protein
LYPSNETFGDQYTKGVVHGLKRDGADLSPDDVGHDVGGDVRLCRDCTQDGQSLRRHLNAVSTEELSRVGGHAPSVSRF